MATGDFLTSFCVIAFLFGMIFMLLPDVYVAWRYGALVRVPCKVTHDDALRPDGLLLVLFLSPKRTQAAC